MKINYSGKTVLITGAASGMALLSAKCFADHGANVVMIDLDAHQVQKQADMLAMYHPGHVLAFACDVRDYTQIELIVQTAYQHFHSIDVMINLAGGAEYRILDIDYRTEFPDCPIDVFDWSLDVNLRGQLYFDHAVMKYMREQRSGVIINIGSVAGHEGSSCNIGYSAAKSAASQGLTKSLALYGAQYQIRVVSVSPGPVLTRAGMSAMKTPIGRAGNPQELVDAYLYLASDHAGFITGVDFLIDGGRLLALDKT